MHLKVTVIASIGFTPVTDIERSDFAPVYSARWPFADHGRRAGPS